MSEKTLFLTHDRPAPKPPDVGRPAGRVQFGQCAVVADQAAGPRHHGFGSDGGQQVPAGEPLGHRRLRPAGPQRAGDRPRHVLRVHSGQCAAQPYPGRQLGPHRARQHRADADPGRRVLAADGRRQADRRELARVVHRHARQRDLPGHRSDVDDVPPPPRDHPRQHRPQPVDQPLDVDVESGPAHRAGLLEEVPERHHAGVVDQHVDPPEPLGDGGGEGVEGLPDRDVQREAVRVRDLRGRGGVQVTDADRRPAGGELRRGRPADPPRPAGDRDHRAARVDFSEPHEPSRSRSPPRRTNPPSTAIVLSRTAS